MMARTQVTLDPETQRRAKQRAHDMGISLSEFIRRAVARDLGDARRPKVDVSSIIGLGNSGGSDIAKNKDRMIAEAFEADLKRSRDRG